MKNFHRRLDDLERRRRPLVDPRGPWPPPRPQTLAAWKLSIQIGAEIEDLGLEPGALDDPDALQWTLSEARYAAAGLDEDAERVAAYRRQLKTFHAATQRGDEHNGNGPDVRRSR